MSLHQTETLPTLLVWFIYCTFITIGCHTISHIPVNFSLFNMPDSIFRPAVAQAIDQMKKAATAGATKTVTIDGASFTIPYPFPSPADWRNNWIYFLMVDRFNNPAVQPKGTWNENFGQRQGGSINGIRAQLGYIASLGASAIWISPLLKNAAPPEWAFNYHGYGAQDFLTIDGRFGSDGSSATAEKELIALVEEAHARGIYVIMDIVINHTARVFDYAFDNTTTQEFKDEQLLNNPSQPEPSIEWINGVGFPRADWTNNLPAASQLSADDAIWPDDLQRTEFFRRRGSKTTDKVSPATGFVKGDFGAMRQLVVEYEATHKDQQHLRKQYGSYPVLNIIIQIYRYMIARFDIDGFRIDTLKYVRPDMVETFGNAMREFALSIGKHNFFTFGEIYDNEEALRPFIGRNTTDGFGVDAALDFPLFFILPKVAKSQMPVEAIRQVFTDRKNSEKKLLSSHGEAGKYFVSFLDNHDQNERFNHAGTPPEQVLCGLAMLFCLQGIPCLYYGTEQGLQGTVNMETGEGIHYENVREALWGKTPAAFDTANLFYQEIKKLSSLRRNEASLQYGRLYFREVSGNGIDFGFSTGTGGVVAFSRILAGREILIVINTHTTKPFKGFTVMDADAHRGGTSMKIMYSNKKTEGQGTVQIFDVVHFIKADTIETGETAALYIELAAMEVQVLAPF